jgi:hypothetical protein
MSEDPKVYERIGDLEVKTAVHEERISDHSKRLDKLEFKVAGWVGLIVVIIQGGYLLLEKMGK